jgi:hypothetical protein
MPGGRAFLGDSACMAGGRRAGELWLASPGATVAEITAVQVPRLVPLEASEVHDR